MIHHKLLARLVCLGAVAAIASVAHANLLVNGSFETYTKPSGSWSVPGVVDLGIPVGTTAITGWTVVNGPIDYVGAGGWQASHGNASIDLGGHPGAGGISQSFATIPGVIYTLSFDFSGNPDPNPLYAGEPKLKQLRVFVDGAASDFSYDTSVESNSFSNMIWKLQQINFTATSNVTNLEFRNMTGNVFTGPAIDNVSVVVSSVPEPGTLALLLLGTLGLIALRRTKDVQKLRPELIVKGSE